MESLATESAQARRVLVLVLPGAFSLDVFGSFEIFQVAAKLLAARDRKNILDPTDSGNFVGCQLAYRVELVGVNPGAVETSNGAQLLVTRALADVDGEIDTVIVAGGVVRLLMQ